MGVVEPRSDGEWEQFSELVARSCGEATTEVAQRIAHQRPSAIARFEVQDDRVVGGALALPCVQYFGGRPVAAGAVSSLCVAPHERGRGTGRRLMWALADAMGHDGIAVAPIYTNAHGFLRSLGWEVAGQSYCFSAPSGALVTEEGSGTAVRDPAPHEVRALRTRIGAQWSGVLERPSWWSNWRAPLADDVCLGWVDGDELVGYMRYRTVGKDGPRGWEAEVVVSDLWAARRSALDGFLRVLSTTQPVSPRIRFAHGVLPADTPLRQRISATLVPEGVRDWLLRVIEPQAALEAAGWPTIAGRIDLEVASLGRAASIMSVEFAGGGAVVVPCQTPRVRMSTGAFAAWFAGAMPATRGAQLGTVSGPSEDLAFMDLLVADRRPWLPDIF